MISRLGHRSYSRSLFRRGFLGRGRHNRQASTIGVMPTSAVRGSCRPRAYADMGIGIRAWWGLLCDSGRHNLDVITVLTSGHRRDRAAWRGHTSSRHVERVAPKLLAGAAIDAPGLTRPLVAKGPALAPGRYPGVGGRDSSDNYLPCVVACGPCGGRWDQTVTAACEWAAQPNPGRPTSGAPRRHNPVAHRMEHLREPFLRLDVLPPRRDGSVRCRGSAGI